MLTLYSAEICPFAQRTRAVLARLDVPFECREIDLSDRDPTFLRLTPTGKVPLLVDGELKLYESTVVGEYLAERYGWGAALAPEPELRSRQRLAMKQWDDRVLPAWYRSLIDPRSFDAKARGKVEGELDEAEATVAAMQGVTDNLMGFHVAPFWARMDWLREHSPIPALIDAHHGLRAWADRAVGLPAILQTLPDREFAVQQYELHYVNR